MAQKVFQTRRIPLIKTRALGCFLAALAILALAISWFLIETTIKEQKEDILDGMLARADALIWSLEGSARFMHKKEIHNLGGMLQEIGRQPGIAWLALVNSDGLIMLDSNEELNNTRLYSRAEMKALAAGKTLQGRFSPDDPDIYETWKLFQPGRFARQHQTAGNNVIFIAIDASFIPDEIHELQLRLWLFAAVVNISLFLLIILAFYIYKFLLSREQLAETEAFAWQVFYSYPDALIVCDNKGEILHNNAHARHLFNLSSSKRSLNLNMLAFYDWSHVFRLLADNKPFKEQNLELHLKNAPPITVNLSANVVNGSADSKFLLAFQDLGEINQLKKRLAHSEKLSETGKLASGLAHEIRNPLSSISGYAHYLISRLQKDPLGLAAARLLSEETTRINDAVSGLLNIIRQPQLKLQANNLAQLLEKACELIRPDADNHQIKISLDNIEHNLTTEWPMTDRDKLLQVLLNLLLNAVQAMPEGGEIKMNLEKIDKKSRQPAGWEIKIQDNGPGMTEEIRRQIFTPYFTTRASGTGLGLAISRQIVESHNGSLEAASQPGKGSLFTLFLPMEQTHA